MAAFAWIALFLIVMGVLFFQKASLSVFSIAMAVLLLLVSFFSSAGWFLVTLLWIIFTVIFIPLNFLPLRRMLFSERAFTVFKRVMPAISDTEREALQAGGIGWEAEIFTGMPDWRKLHKIPYAKLTDEEQAFISGPTEQLCTMIDNWQISRSMHIPDEIWQFLKSEGFLGLIISKEYGGNPMSAVALAAIIMKISSASIAVGSIVAVPNSLGPGELLTRYGTDEQKNYYLPRLASGEEIPCFALTSPVAGSDAGSIVDYGVVCEHEFEGKKQIGIRLNWDKRYITLAPVATLLGLAFKLYDPDHFLGANESLGITCALIPTSTEGVVTGRRHYPLDCAFPNGPTQGKDVFIPIDWIIGGRNMAGKGWRMLMECLAAGRAISLPSMCLGAAKCAALASGAYARIRRQFNTYIGHFGGVEEALAGLTGRTYIAEALRLFTVSDLDSGHHSAVASAISKYHTTELCREAGKFAMDIQGGKGICMGPKNYLAQSYIEAPIGITVEGANILTRSMIIFGQGAMRCHPYILKEMHAAQETDPLKALQDFDKALFGHIGQFLSSLARSFWLGITHGLLARAPNNRMKRYYQHFSRFSAVLSLIADISMLTIGAELKRLEKLSARLGDLLSLCYMGSAVLKHYNHGTPTGPIEQERVLAQWCCQFLLHRIETQLLELLHNMPNQKVAWLLRIFTLPLGRHFKMPSDALGARLAKLMLEPTPVRQRFTQHIYYTPNQNNPVARMEKVLEQVIAIEPLEKRLEKARREKRVDGKTFDELLEMALRSEIIAAHEVVKLREAHAARMEVIHVDDFPPEFFNIDFQKNIVE